MAQAWLAFALITPHAMAFPPHGGSAAVQAGPLPTTILTSTTSGSTKDFMVSQVFAEGAIPGGCGSVVVNAAAVAIGKRNWNDGSCKQVITAGSYSSAGANQGFSLKYTTGMPPGGAALTCSNIQSASPSATVNLGTVGSVSLASLLASPSQTWISNPYFVECDYFVTSITNYYIEFYVKLWADGNIRISGMVEYYPAIDLAQYSSVADANYTAEATVGGTCVQFCPSGSAITHYKHTAWFFDGWIGTNPSVTQTPSASYLKGAHVAPNYFSDAASSSVLNGLTQRYTPFSHGDWAATMGDTGFQPQIGVWPEWDAFSIMSNFDSRALNATLSDTLMLESYPTVWRGSTDNWLPARPSKYPTISWCDNVGGGGCGIQAPATSGGLEWDPAHHGDAIAAYLFTGEFYYLEIAEMQASLAYFAVTAGNGSGTSRSMLTGAVREPGWITRTLADVAAFAPTGDLFAADVQAVVKTTASSLASNCSISGINGLTVCYEYDMYQGTFSPSVQNQMSPSFMYDYLLDGLARAYNVEALVNSTDQASLKSIIQTVGAWDVGRLGTSGGSGFCAEYAAADFRMIGTASAGFNTSNTLSQVLQGIDANWGLVWSQNFSGSTCDNAMHGTSNSDPAAGNISYWMYLHDAISSLADVGVTGASASEAKMTGFSNWNTLRHATPPADCPSFPVFCTEPWGLNE